MPEKTHPLHSTPTDCAMSVENLSSAAKAARDGPSSQPNSKCDGPHTGVPQRGKPNQDPAPDKTVNNKEYQHGN